MLKTSFWGAAKALAAMFITFSIASCGGGGGGSPPDNPIPVERPPVIAQQPASQTVQEGSAATFSVALQAGDVGSYQWLRNGVAVAGATAPSYTLAAAALADSGTAWTVRIVNAGGSVTSDAAVLTVTSLPYVPPAGLSLFLGDESSPGYADGTGRSARFNGISGIALDAAGNVFVADAGNNVLRKVTPAGAVTTVPASASATLPVPGNCYQTPGDIAVGGDGDLYVLDGASQAVCRQAPGGDAVQVAGTIAGARFIARGPGSVTYVATAQQIFKASPGTATLALTGAVFTSIRGLATDAAGNAYVTDEAADTSGGVRKVSPDGTVTMLASAYAGTSTTPRFADLQGIAVDATGNVFVVAGMPAGRPGLGGAVHRVSAAGEVTLAVHTGLFLAGDKADLAFDAAGNLYYATKLGIGKIAVGGARSQLAGRQLAGEGAPTTEFPIAADSGGNVFTADLSGGEPVVRKYGPAGNRLAYGQQGQGLVLPDPLANGMVSFAIDAADNVYVAYMRWRTENAISEAASSEIYRITPAGSASLWRASAKGEANFAAPVNMSFDSAGNMYFWDAATFAIRRLSQDGALVSLTSTGNPIWGTTTPVWPGVVATGSGTVYLVDGPTRVIQSPVGGNLAVRAGTLFEPAAIVDATGPSARFIEPGSPTVDAAGNVYVTDSTLLRRMGTDFAVRTVAGRQGVSPIQLGALPASIGGIPSSLVAARDGTLYVRSGSAILRVRP